MSEVKVTAARVTSCRVDLGDVNAPLEPVFNVIRKLLDGDRIVTIRCTWKENQIADGLSQLGLVHKDWNGQSHVYEADKLFHKHYNDKLKKFSDQLRRVQRTLEEPPDSPSSMSFDWNTKA